MRHSYKIGIYTFMLYWCPRYYQGYLKEALTHDGCLKTDTQQQWAGKQTSDWQGELGSRSEMAGPRDRHAEARIHFSIKHISSVFSWQRLSNILKGDFKHQHWMSQCKNNVSKQLNTFNSENKNVTNLQRFKKRQGSFGTSLCVFAKTIQCRKVQCFFCFVFKSH